MKWTPEQIAELKEMCFQEISNTQMALHFGVAVTEIHAKRSQLDITIPKIRAAKGQSAAPANKPVSNNALPDGLEHFNNGLMRCIVLARQGDIALICIHENILTPFVVPLEHKYGASDWWQGKYFETLEAAWAYYQKQIGG